MTEVTYMREGKGINPEPILVKIVEPYMEFDPECLIEILAKRLLEYTRITPEKILHRTAIQG